MSASRISLLICFAVPEEAASFRRLVRLRDGLSICRTGMGEVNARSVFLRQVDQSPPDYVVTTGFAGGLSKHLKPGDIVWDRDQSFPAVGVLANPMGRATFTHTRRVAWSIAQKTQLHRETGADAVDMESMIIRSECASLGIPSATVRVISDTANEDLPMDFHLVMSSGMQINWMKLFCYLIAHPRTVSKLLRFRRRIEDCGQVLGSSLASLPDELSRKENLGKRQDR